MGVFYFLSFLSLSSYAAGNQIDCYHVTEGEDVGGKFEVKMAFNSKAPSYVDTTIITLKDRPPKEQKTTYLSAKSVCGLDLDFDKDCKFTEKITEKFGYGFSFTCGKEITFAEIYCDENCMTSEKGGATFKCEGPKVSKKLSDGGLVYNGCEFTKAKKNYVE